MSRMGMIIMIAALATAACDSPAELPGNQPGTGQPGTGNPPAGHPVAASISIGGYALPMLAGDTARLTATAYDGAGTVLPLPVSWSSADTARATVTPEGLLRARSGGSVRINVTVGSQSTHAMIAIRNRAAVVDELSPRSAGVGSGPVMIRLQGSNFVPGAQVMFGGESLPTMRISDTELRAEVPAARLRNFGVAQVTVLNPESQGPSAPRSFAIERNPLVSTTYRLVGLEDGTALPVEVDRFRYRHFPTGEEYDQVIRAITAGRLVLEARGGEETQFLQYYTETLTDVATGAVVHQSELVWFGFVSYDMLDGSIILVSGGLPGTVRGRVSGETAMVLEQAIGGTSRSWRYVKQ
jgi:hypothetical protein